jgi:hypothetical protein
MAEGVIGQELPVAVGICIMFVVGVFIFMGVWLVKRVFPFVPPCNIYRFPFGLILYISLSMEFSQ